MNLPAHPNIAIVGATGAVGLELLTLMPEREFLHGRVRLLASARSAGRRVPYCGTELVVEELEPESFNDTDLVFFSAGGGISREHAPRAVAAGAVVIDNSSAFRLDERVPLVVPEINPRKLEDIHGPAIIANPNCTTIVTLMAVTPLHRAVGVKRMIVSSYQAVSGAGAAWMRELEDQSRQFAAGEPYTTDVSGRQLLFNVFSHDSPIDDSGYNEEERKLTHETHKIWDDDDVRISGTCVRVPVLRAHCVSVTLELEEPMGVDDAREIISGGTGVRVVDDRDANQFPEPIHASGIDDVLVGRIRRDASRDDDRGLVLFAAGDQIRKGAALNALQIAEALIHHEVRGGLQNGV